MSVYEKLKHVVARKKEIETQMASGETLSADVFVQLSKELAEITPVANVAQEVLRMKQDIYDLKEMLKDLAHDKEMQALTREELHSLEAQLPEKEHEIQVLLLPKDAADEKNAIMEIRAGTGGDEAALFGADLLRMYQRYAELKGWKFTLMHLNETDIGGVKEASIEITGKDVFARLKFESGVHRVQRVPTTEASGRIHTSAATVAVLPEAEEVDIRIEEKDLRIDVFRSSGPGGQSVNTTDSATPNIISSKR